MSSPCPEVLEQCPLLVREYFRRHEEYQGHRVRLMRLLTTQLSFVGLHWLNLLFLEPSAVNRFGFIVSIIVIPLVILWGQPKLIRMAEDLRPRGQYVEVWLEGEFARMQAEIEGNDAL